MAAIKLDEYCVRCGSDRHTRASEHGGGRFCTLCWKGQKPIPSSLLRYIRELEAAVLPGQGQP